MHSHLIDVAFSIIRERFDFSRYNIRGRPFAKHSLDTLWNWLVTYFKETPHKVPQDNTLRFKHHGVPSGSMFTNLVDSIISTICMKYLHTVNFCWADVRGYGDDVIARHCTCRNAYLESHAQEHLGMRLKVVPPNEHGCLTYCKAECHHGRPFHSGLWFRNILNCTRHKAEAAECLMYAKPTRLQLKELKRERNELRPSRPTR